MTEVKETGRPEMRSRTSRIAGIFQQAVHDALHHVFFGPFPCPRMDEPESNKGFHPAGNGGGY